MKKFTSALLAVAAMATTAFAGEVAASKTGFYLGGNVGLASTNVKYGYTNSGATATAAGNAAIVGGQFSASDRAQDFSANAGKMNPQFGLFAGYGMQLGNVMYVGLEAYAGLDSAKVTPYDDSKTGRAGGYWKTEVKRKNYYGITPRVGFMINPNTLMYVKMGIEGGKWEATLTPNAATVDGYTNAGATTAQKDTSKAIVKKSANKISFAPGVGMDAFITKNLFLRAEYSYLFGPKVTIDANVSGYDNSVMAGTGVAHKFEITQHAFKLGLGYKF